MLGPRMDRATKGYMLPVGHARFEADQLEEDYVLCLRVGQRGVALGTRCLWNATG